MEVKGIITAMVTPFKDTGEIDEERTRTLIQHLLNKQVHGLFILGTNGEFHLLSEKEKLTFAEIVLTEVAGRVPVYVGTGGNSTAEVISLSLKMEKLGADAVSIITPYFVAPSQEELVEHYQKIAKALTIPILLYNIPKNTGVNLSVETVKALAKEPTIIGIKDSSGAIENIKSYIEATVNEEFAVLSGSDSLILAALEIGAKGAIAATSNVLTWNDVEIYRQWTQGNLTAAKEQQENINEFRRILKFGTIPSVLKKSLEIIGLPVGAPRLPVKPVKSDAIREIEKVLSVYQQAKIIR